MINDKLEIFKRKNKIILSYDDIKEVIFDEKSYNDSINKFGTDDDKVFNIISDKYGIKEIKDLEDNFLYLFNFILVNNLSNYIVDLAFKLKKFKITIDERSINKDKNKIKLSKRMDVDDVLGNILICIMNKDEYFEEIIMLERENALSKNEKIEKLVRKELEEYFHYEPLNIRELREKLKKDLIEYEYVSEKSKNKQGRYLLPIYVDEQKLKNSIPNYEEFLINWTSIAYLKMVEKIHDNFLNDYKLDLKRGLINDDLTLALVSLLDAEIENYPTGIQKSLEKGRAVNGKCFFIEKIVTPVALPQDLAMVLQARDAFEVIPSLFKAKVN